MATSNADRPLAREVRCTHDTLVVGLDDGRTLRVPLAWFPRLRNAAPAERAEFRPVGEGEGIHWPVVDEDLSVAGLLAGRRHAARDAA